MNFAFAVIPKTKIARLVVRTGIQGAQGQLEMTSLQYAFPNHRTGVLSQKVPRSGAMKDLTTNVKDSVKAAMYVPPWRCAMTCGGSRFASAGICGVHDTALCARFT